MTHTYTHSNQNCTIVVTTQQSGNSYSAQWPVHIADMPPSLYVVRAASVVEGQPYALSISGVEPTGSTAVLQSYHVDWGDGATTTLNASTYENGVFPATVALTHDYSGAASSYPLNVTATDSDGTYTAVLNNDSAFAGGRVITDVNSGSSDRAYQPLVQPDGKVLVAGVSNNTLAILRYNADGSLDNSFNGNGKVLTGLTIAAIPNSSIALQSDGSIIAVGANGMKKYLSDGSLDSSFSTTATSASAVAVQSDDSIILYNTGHLSRYTSSGALDTTFGSGGTVSTLSHFHVSAIMVEPDDSIVLAGYFTTLQLSFVLAHYTASGALDTNFGPAHLGYVNTTLGTMSVAIQGAPTCMTMDASGDILVGGYTDGYDSTGGEYFAVARYLPAGTIDTSFGMVGNIHTGYALISFETPASPFTMDTCYGIGVLDTGQIVAAGVSVSTAFGTNFAVARINPADGTLDTTFGAGGKLLAGIGASSTAFGVAILPDQRVIAVGGTSSNFGFNDFGLGAFLPDNTVRIISDIANFAAVPLSTTQIKLTWSLLFGSGSTIEIDGSTDGINFTPITTVDGGVTSFTDSGLNPNTQYYYQIIVGDSISDPATTWTLLPAPSGLSVTITDAHGVHLSWPSVVEADGYQIERSDDGGATFYPIGTPDDTSFDDAVPDGAATLYRFEALNPGGASAPSATASAAMPLLAPTDLSAYAVSDSQIQLSWESPSDQTATFLVERSIDDVNFTQVATASDGDYLDAELDPDTQYYYRLRAQVGGLQSAYSQEANATTDPAVPVIQLTGDPTATLGVAYNLGLSAAYPQNNPTWDTVTFYQVDWGDEQFDGRDGPTNAATHTYSQGGVFTITVTATCPAGQFIATLQVAVAPPTPGSILFPGYDPNSIPKINEGTDYSFSASYSGNSTLRAWIVDFGDGSGDQQFDPSTSTFDHTYAHGGPGDGQLFAISVVAVTDAGLARATRDLKVTSSYQPRQNNIVVGSVQQSGSSGGLIYWFPCGYVPVPVVVDWGDHSTSIFEPDDPNLNTDSSGDYNLTPPPHQYAEEGTYFVTANSGGYVGYGFDPGNDDESGSLSMSSTNPQIVAQSDTLSVSAGYSGFADKDLVATFVDWGDGAGSHFIGMGGGTINASRSAADLAPGVYTGTLTATEESGDTVSTHFVYHVSGPVVLIDANNDSGLAVPTLADTPAAEQKIADDSDKPGKLITINTSDKDGDGIPDYADGFGVFSDQTDSQDPPTGDQGAGFVPITLVAPEWMDPAHARVQIIYNGSNPSAVTRSGSGTPDDPYVYSPDPEGGNIRLWAKDESQQRNPASIGSGGDWVQPDETFDATKLTWTGHTAVLYVEAVAASTDLGGEHITAVLTATNGAFNGHSASSSVRLTAFGLQTAQVNPDGTTTVVDQPEISAPSPVISLTDYELSNVRFSPDFTTILADLNISGTITDAASDLLSGNAGTISTATLALNGTTLANGTITVTANKSSDSTSLLHPYAYSGSFDQIIAITVQPGWNLIHLSAKNAYGYSGFAEASLEVDVKPKSVHVTIVQPYEDQMTVIYDNDPTTAKNLTQSQEDPALYIGDSVQVRTSPLDGQGNENIQITDGLRGIDSQMKLKPQPGGGMAGDTTYDPEQQDDYRNFTVAAGQTLFGNHSTGGLFNPFMLQLVAPDALASQLKINASGIDFNAIKWNGKFELTPANQNLSMPEIFLATPAQMPADQTNEPQTPRRDGFGNYLKGVGSGLATAGWQMVEALWTMGKLSVQAQALPAYIGIRLTSGHYVEDKQQLIAKWDSAKTIATVLWQLSKAVGTERETLVNGLILGNNDALNQLGVQGQIAGEIMGAIWDKLGDWLENADDYKRGRVVGIILGNLLPMLVGVGDVAELSKVALLQRLLARLKGLEEIQPIIDELVEIAKGLRATNMCFVAGTLVHSAEGLKPIERISAGDLVLSRDQETGEQIYKPVLETFVTHPSRLYHITLQGPTGQQQTLSCTGQHPFHLASRGAFVAASELQPQDSISLAEGGESVVLSIVLENALDNPFTTYNFHVADFNTYFVGEAGAWVHNTGDGLCEMVNLLFQRITKRYGLQQEPWAAFKLVMQATARVAPEIDPALPKTVDEVMLSVYKQAVDSNGAIHLDEIPDVEAMRQVMWGRGETSLIDIHHTAVKAWARELIPGITDAELDKMPGLLVRAADHRIAGGEGAFHAILQKKLPYGSTGDTDKILKGLEETYEEWDPKKGPLVWKAVSEWLRIHKVKL